MISSKSPLSGAQPESGASTRQIHSRWPRSALVLACLGALTGLTACQTTSPDVDGRFAPSMHALLEQELTGELSDWDRAVIEKALETGQISHADYVEGENNYEACMTENDYALDRTEHLNGIIEFQPGPGPIDEAYTDAMVSASYTCRMATSMRTQELYRFQIGNPDLLTDTATVVTRCLADAGVVDDSFTRDDFQQNVMGTFNASALPFDIMDPRAQACLYTAGMSFTVLDE